MYMYETQWERVVLYIYINNMDVNGLRNGLGLPRSKSFSEAVNIYDKKTPGKIMTPSKCRDNLWLGFCDILIIQ